MSVPRFSTLMAGAGFTVKRWQDGLVLDGERCAIRPMDSTWGMLARAPRILPLGVESEHAARLPVRYIFLNKPRDCVLVVETALSKFWYRDRGKISAPLCIAEFVRIHGAPQSYLIADLMKERLEPPRRLSTPEAHWLTAGSPRERRFAELVEARCGVP